MRLAVTASISGISSNFLISGSPEIASAGLASLFSQPPQPTGELDPSDAAGVDDVAIGGGETLSTSIAAVRYSSFQSPQSLGERHGFAKGGSAVGSHQRSHIASRPGSRRFRVSTRGGETLSPLAVCDVVLWLSVDGESSGGALEKESVIEWDQFEDCVAVRGTLCTDLQGPTGAADVSRGATGPEARLWSRPNHVESV